MTRQFWRSDTHFGRAVEEALQRNMCLLNCNELPLHHIFWPLDGVTTVQIITNYHAFTAQMAIFTAQMAEW